MLYAPGPCSNCDPCGGAIPTPTLTGVTCVSRAGEGWLRGWSKLADWNAGDWNMRKATRLHFSKSTEVNCYELGLYCESTGMQSSVGYGRRSITQPDAIWDVAADSLNQSATAHDFYCDAIDPDSSYALVHPIYDPFFVNATCAWDVAGTGPEETIVDAWHSFQSHAANPITDSWFTIGPATDFLCGACAEPDEADGIEARLIPFNAHTVSCVLTDFDTVFNALGRDESVTVAALCQTVPTSLGSTLQASNEGIAIAATAVVTSIGCAGLVNGNDYVITATLTRRDAGDDSFISSDEVLIEFTASGTTDTVDYDVPIEDGVKVEFTSADSIAAA